MDLIGGDGGALWCPKCFADAPGATDGVCPTCKTPLVDFDRWLDSPGLARAAVDEPPAGWFEPAPAPAPKQVATRGERRERTVAGVVYVVALLPVALVVMGVYWILSGNGRPANSAPAVSPTSSSSAARPGAHASAPSRPAVAASAPSKSPSSPRPSATLPGSTKHCSAKVAVKGGTSCGFGLNVAKALPAKLPSARAFTVKASSPVTHKTYVLACTNGPVVKCVGGRSAEIYIIPG